MYKNIKIFKKSENLNNKFSHASIEKKLENNKLIPIGIDEVIKYASSFPIIISGKEEHEFVLFSGLSTSNNFFVKCEGIDEPEFLQTYPFLMIDIKDEKDNNVSAIAYDKNDEYVGVNKDIEFFNDNKLNQEVINKIEKVRLLQTKRNLAKMLIKELKDKDLLIKQSFNIKIKDEVRTILKDYYIINRTKMCKLDDKTISTWTRNGWIGLIDAHMFSLRNFQKLVNLIK